MISFAKTITSSDLEEMITASVASVCDFVLKGCTSSKFIFVTKSHFASVPLYHAYLFKTTITKHILGINWLKS